MLTTIFKKLHQILIFVLLVLLSTLSTVTLAGNVILIIGDGMDDNQIAIARNYLVGSGNKLIMDQLPQRSAVQVLGVDEEDPNKVVYVADSANSATSIATGIITSPGRIGTSAGSDEDALNIIEILKAYGLKVGLVTTSSITDATPASFFAHVNDRGCENPSMMVEAEVYAGIIADCSQDLKANGGLGSISEQLIDMDVDVALGGGMEHFTPLVENSNLSVLEYANESGYFIVDEEKDLQGISNAKVLGLFSPDTMPVRWRGEDDRAAEKPNTSFLNMLHPLLGSVTYPKVMDCEDNPAHSGMPSLGVMTKSAIELLSADGSDFFLMVESASIDKQAHERKACGSIGELQQLEESLYVALNFAEEEPETLILVTADHGHAAQILAERTIYESIDLPIHTPGYVARLRTPEGSIMTVNYATNNFVSEEHTGVHVPLMSNLRDVRGLASTINQPDIFHIIKDYLIE